MEPAVSTPTTLCDLLGLLRKSALVPEHTLAELTSARRLPDDPVLALDALVQKHLLTRFQAQHLQAGKYKGFVIGPYKVLRPLGKGGMGVVYLAEHTHLGRRVAVKVLRSDLADKAGVHERFLREARIAATLDHPNVVRVQDAYLESEPRCLIMEYVEGKSLRTLLHERGRLPTAQAVGYVLQAACGLEHAHERGVLHRDVKPANLIVTPNEVVKLLDMGLARFDDDRHDRLTERLGGNSVLGSADFIAPEQILNKADQRSDVFSLGATLYVSLVGQPPFPFGRSAERLLDRRTQPVRPPHLCDAAIPEGLSWVVVRMLAKDPEARYQSAGEVIEALAPFVYAEARSQVVAITPSRRSPGLQLRDLVSRLVAWWKGR